MKTYIIAEAGINIGNSIEAPKKMIEVVKSIGADCIKWQAYIPKLTAQGNKELENVLERNHLNKSDLQVLKEHCSKTGIDFLCSCFEEENLDWLADIGETRVKIPSCRNTDIKFLNKAAQLFKEIVLATGMMCGRDLTLPLLILKQGTELKNIALLHCVSAYPCSFEEINLLAMNMLKSLAGKVGLSDHTVGWEVPVAAVAMGAQIIEKHFTLKRADKPDDCVSLEPDEFADMVRRIRNVELAMGDGVKKIEKSERKLLWRKERGTSI